MDCFQYTPPDGTSLITVFVNKHDMTVSTMQFYIGRLVCPERPMMYSAKLIRLSSNLRFSSVILFSFATVHRALLGACAPDVSWLIATSVTACSFLNTSKARDAVFLMKLLSFHWKKLY